MRIRLIRTHAGTPALLGQRRGEDVASGIRKTPVVAETVEVGPTNIDGDGQADLVNHGGTDKAIYCYSHDHLPAWDAEIGYTGDGAHAPFGENLAVSGFVETDVCIGDTWRWGGALLQVSQPRWPCYKLDLHTSIDGMMNRLIRNGRSGWYLRVLTPGIAPTTGTIELVNRDPLGITVAEAFNARRDPRMPPDRYHEIMDHPLLAAAWSR